MTVDKPPNPIPAAQRAPAALSRALFAPSWAARAAVPSAAAGHWLVNAPNTFTLPAGDPGSLSATDNDADESQTVTVQTDSRGFAWVYWKR